MTVKVAVPFSLPAVTAALTYQTVANIPPGADVTAIYVEMASSNTGPVRVEPTLSDVDPGAPGGGKYAASFGNGRWISATTTGTGTVYRRFNWSGRIPVSRNAYINLSAYNPHAVDLTVQGIVIYEQ